MSRSDRSTQLLAVASIQLQTTSVTVQRLSLAVKPSYITGTIVWNDVKALLNMKTYFSSSFHITRIVARFTRTIETNAFPGCKTNFYRVLGIQTPFPRGFCRTAFPSAQSSMTQNSFSYYPLPYPTPLHMGETPFKTSTSIRRVRRSCPAINNRRFQSLPNCSGSPETCLCGSFDTHRSRRE